MAKDTNTLPAKMEQVNARSINEFTNEYKMPSPGKEGPSQKLQMSYSMRIAMAQVTFSKRRAKFWEFSQKLVFTTNSNFWKLQN